MDKLGKTLEALEKSSQPGKAIVVAIDKVELSVDALEEILLSRRLQKIKVLCACRENVWAKRVKPKLEQYSNDPFYIRDFTEGDAEKILEKLQIFGSWTILGQMTKRERIDALIVRSGKQLLIALLEATFGDGFHKMIEHDYASLSNKDEQIFLLTVGVITDRNLDAPASLVDRALNSLGILSTSVILAGGLVGIVLRREGKLTVRHPVYVRHLLEHVVNPELTAIAIGGLLHAFSHYRSPVMKHLSKVEAAIYKGLINHRFLWDVLKGRESLIVPLYQKLEKYFEMDGLFWLQYGLALRDFKNNPEALEKMKIAYAAFPGNHTQHALGHQLLISANEASDRTAAMNSVDEAIKFLESLDYVIDSDDTYPIVTLAEGHTRVVRKFDGESEAKLVARSYLPLLARRTTVSRNNDRLQSCHNNLFRFISTGTWIEPQTYRSRPTK